MRFWKIRRLLGREFVQPEKAIPVWLACDLRFRGMDGCRPFDSPNFEFFNTGAMDHPPKSICLLRLSAIGDVAHMVPVARTIQKYWPATKLSWIIGKGEARLVHGISGIEFIEFDKAGTLSGYRSLARKLGGRRFDVLLCPQVSFRANLASSLVRADLKLGYDRARAKDLHSLFLRQHVAPASRQHVLDGFFSFIEHLGLRERDLRWDYHIPDEAREFAGQHLANDRFNVLISPCSSHPLRNWSAPHYAAVADHAARTLDAQVILCGGPSAQERQMGQEIEKHMQSKPLNLIGKDTLKKFLALLQGADALISPDSGPAHMAAGVGTPVIGLYAASNPHRSGPYLSQQWCVNKYGMAAQTFKNKSEDELKWGTKLEYEGVMDLIEVDEVTSRLDALAGIQ